MIKRANQKKKKGFSLIELIIVLAVMAIIALIAIPNFTAVKNNSKIKADVQTCETIKRNILMLTADETIELTDVTKQGTIAVTFNTDGKTAVLASGAVVNVAENNSGAILESLKEVNAPQSGKLVDTDGTATADPTTGKKIIGYTITIGVTGDVSVDTTSN